MDHKKYMRRCFDLARLGAGQVSPNPMVGAVLVYKDRIIGEGWHRQYGHAHAEVNAINNVDKRDAELISQSTLYVSLEPCCIHGRTPPCTDLILQYRIPRVVISNIDLTAEVSGRGVELLRKAGVDVITGVLEEEGYEMSKFRNVFSAKNRPYILLKFARSEDGFMGMKNRQVWISNVYSKRYAHKLRSEYDAILVGTGTVKTDDPALNNRLWYGRSPVRVVLDRNLKIDGDRQLFRIPGRTWVVTEQAVDRVERDQVEYLKLAFDDRFLPALLAELAGRKITSLLVEGGARTILAFLKAGLWDEACVFTGNCDLRSGIAAPVITGEKVLSFPIQDDLLTIYRNYS